jgi:hypothetical protein
MAGAQVGSTADEGGVGPGQRVALQRGGLHDVGQIGGFELFCAPDRPRRAVGPIPPRTR